MGKAEIETFSVWCKYQNKTASQSSTTS